MYTHELLIIFITLVLAAAFLYIWKRRDTGHVSDDPRSDARHEPAGRERL